MEKREFCNVLLRMSSWKYYKLIRFCASSKWMWSVCVYLVLESTHDMHRLATYLFKMKLYWKAIRNLFTFYSQDSVGSFHRLLWPESWSNLILSCDYKVKADSSRRKFVLWLTVNLSTPQKERDLPEGVCHSCRILNIRFSFHSFHFIAVDERKSKSPPKYCSNILCLF